MSKHSAGHCTPGTRVRWFRVRVSRLRLGYTKGLPVANEETCTRAMYTSQSDIAGNRVGWEGQGHRVEDRITQAIGEISGRSVTSAHEWPELRGARGILSKLSWYSLNPCREACLFHRPAMLTDVDYWIACGGYDPSALGSMIPRAGHGRCSGIRQTAIAKSLGRNRA